MISSLRASKSGLAREAQQKVEKSFDPDEAMKSLLWIREVTGQNIPLEAVDHEKHKVMEFFYETLKDGLLLCHLINCIVPEDIQINMKEPTFKKSSNDVFEAARERARLEIFAYKCQDFGVPESLTFQTDSLYEKTNLPQVVSTIRSLGIETKNKMKVVLFLVCICVVYVTAAPKKRFLVDDIAGEASKILKCEGEVHEEGCRKCCDEQKWYLDAEKAACNAACNILPNKGDYITTTSFPYSTFKPIQG